MCGKSAHVLLAIIALGQTLLGARQNRHERFSFRLLRAGMSPREMVVMWIFYIRNRIRLIDRLKWTFSIQVLPVKIKSFLWTFPFLFFILGYTTLSFLRGQQQLAAPALIGQTVANATLILAQHHLNFRILAQKEDNDLPHGTILSQLPSAGKLMRLNQSVFCVISKKTSSIPAPNCVGISLASAQSCCAALSITPHIYYVPSFLPANICIAQSPDFGESINDRSIMLYCAAPSSSLMIIPSFIGVSVNDALSALELYQIKPLVMHAKNHALSGTKNKYTIVEQKPLAGSILDINSLHTMQFLVE